MKATLVLILGFLSLNLQAQSRGQILHDLRSWSDSVRDETYSTQASDQDLRQAKDLLEQAHSLLAGTPTRSDILCSRASFGYVPVNTATGMSYGQSVSTLNECSRMLPMRGARAMCAKGRFGYQAIVLDRGIFIGESSFSTLDQCLELAPIAGQKIMCARDRFGFRPYSLNNLMGLGNNVSTSSECLSLLPQRGSNLMCIKDNFGYQPINITTGRSFGQRTSTLSECHRLIGNN